MIFVSHLKVAGLQFAYYSCPRLVFSVVLPFHLWAKEEVPSLQNKFAFARYIIFTITMSWTAWFKAVYNTVRCTCCLAFADNLKMTFEILIRFCLVSFLFIHLIFAAGGNVHVFQKPRFIGVKTGRTVIIYCVPSNPNPFNGSFPVEWSKDPTFEKQLQDSHKIKIMKGSNVMNASITLKKVETEDSGTYFCRLKGSNGPGTELQVSSRCQFVNVVSFAFFSSLYTHIFLFLLQDTVTPKVSWWDRESRMLSFSFRVYCWFCALSFLWCSITDWWGPEHFSFVHFSM